MVAVAAHSGHALVRLAGARRGRWGLPAGVIGAGKTARASPEHLRANPGLDLKVLVCLGDDPRKRGTEIAGVPVVGRLAGAPRLQRVWRATYGIETTPGVEPARLAHIVQRHANASSHLVAVLNAFGLTSVGVGSRDLGGFVGLYKKHHLLPRNNRVLTFCWRPSAWSRCRSSPCAPWPSSS